MVRKSAENAQPIHSWLKVYEPPTMPFGRYRGERIDKINDYAEIRKFASYPFSDLLTDDELRAINRRLSMVHPDAGEGGDDIPFEFVERCRESSRREQAGGNE